MPEPREFAVARGIRAFAPEGSFRGRDCRLGRDQEHRTRSRTPGELWRRQGAGEWELVPVPDFAEYPRWARGPTDVVALTRDDVWLVASGRVLHTRLGTGPIQEIASDAFAAH